MGIGYLHRSSRISKIQTNQVMKNIMQVSGNILDTVGQKQFMWYDYLQKMDSQLKMVEAKNLKYLSSDVYI